MSKGTEMKLSKHQILKCRLCGEQSFSDILDLGQQFFTGRFVRPEQEDPAKARLAICSCTACGLVQLKDSYPASEMYGVNYGYRSSITETMRKHLQGIRDSTIAFSNLGGKTKVLDIGSNDGTLLNYFGEVTDNLMGIDPCAEKHKENYNDHARLIPDYFSAENLKRHGVEEKFDVITSIAMFYDIDAPVDFAKDIRSMLSLNGIWVTEQTHSHTLLESNCYDSICHEHVSYLSLEAMDLICKEAGLKILRVDTNDINGGSFRLTISRSDSSFQPNYSSINTFLKKEESLRLKDTVTWKAFNEKVFLHKAEFELYIKKQTENGKKIFGYGASTKGNVLLQFFNISTKIMPYILERDPKKYGLVTPGTRIPIISEEEGRLLNPDILVVFPWHFKDEIIKREADFLNNGGVLVFPLPELTLVSKEQLS